jgi:hypothetical protein
MGFYKTRLTTIITAKLVSWRLRGTGVEGIIKESISKEYQDGESWLLMNVTFNHYKYAEGFWPDHFIIKNQTGNYFMLKDCDKFKGMGDASLV